MNWVRVWFFLVRIKDTEGIDKETHHVHGLRHSVGYSISERLLARRSRFATAGAAADRGWNPFSRALRNNRRKPHADSRRAQARGGNNLGGGTRQGAGGRGSWRLRHSGSSARRPRV